MKLIKKLLAVVLCLTLCLSLGVTALAANGGDGTVTDKTADASKAGFMKTITIDNDLISAFKAADPNQSFVFTFAPGTEDSNNAVFAPTGFTKSFTAAEMTAAENLLYLGFTVNDLLGITSADAATAALTDKGIDHAGVWVYKVTETTDTSTSTGTETITGSNPGTLTKTLTKSDKEYTLRIYVVNGGDGLKIKFVTVWDGEKKIDPTLKPVVDPGTDETTSKTESEFLFTGSYRETFKADDNPTPDPGKKDYGAFTVTKKISDDTREYADLTKTFKIQIKVTAASNLTADELAAGFKYTIYTEKTTTAAASLSAEQSGAYGATITVNLSDGDVFRIQELPVGCEFSVSEPDYGSTWAADHYKNVSVAYDSSLTTALAKAGGIHGAVTNAFDVSVVPPTGIIVNNLPFVLIVALAVGGIVLFFIANRRRREEENEG